MNLNEWIVKKYDVGYLQQREGKIKIKATKG